MIEIFAVMVGFLLGLVPVALERRRSNRAALLWIRIAISHNEQCLRSYQRDRIFSPAYRLISDFAGSLPKLLADSFLTTDETESISDYVARCEEVNRCLEELAALVAASRTLDEAVHFGQPQKARTDLKVTNIIEPLGDSPSRADNARRIIGNSLSRAGI